MNINFINPIFSKDTFQAGIVPNWHATFEMKIGKYSFQMQAITSPMEFITDDIPSTPWIMHNKHIPFEGWCLDDISDVVNHHDLHMDLHLWGEGESNEDYHIRIWQMILEAGFEEWIVSELKASPLCPAPFKCINQEIEDSDFMESGGPAAETLFSRFKRSSGCDLLATIEKEGV